MKKYIFVFIIILVVLLLWSKQPKFFRVPALLQKFAKFNAITLPPFGMFFSSGHFVESTIRHEMVHWQQYQRMGFFKFYLMYLWYTFKYGYANNPMEIEAFEVNSGNV